MDEGEGEAGKRIKSFHVIEISSSSSDILLPDELIVDILLRLDLKDVLRFRYVSKSWYALINDRNFMEKHVVCIESRANLSLIIREYRYHGDELYKVDLNHVRFQCNAVKLTNYPFKYYRLFNRIVGSCNDLVCLYNHSKCGIWNPSARKFHELPTMPIHFGGHEIGNRNASVYGFGHNRITDDYKVIGINTIYRRHDSAHLGIGTRVYSLKTKSWAKESQYFFPDKSLYDATEPGTFASISNALYWIMNRIEVGLNNQQHYFQFIGVFDLGVDNGYHEVELPDYKPKNDNSYYKRRTYPKTLGVLRGCLCLFSTNYVYSSDLWVMKESSWTRLISFADPYPDWKKYMKIRPLAYSRSGDNKLLLYDDLIRKLIWYDLKNKTTTIVQLQEGLRLDGVCVHRETTVRKEGRDIFSSSWCKIFGGFILFLLLCTLLICFSLTL